MTRPRAAVAALVAAVGVLQTASALAAITSPADGTILHADPVVQGSVDVGRSASGVTLNVTGPAGILTAGGACGAQGVSCSGNVVTFNVPLSLDRNGGYTVKAVGYHRATSPLDSDATNTETSTFGLEIPPRAPRKLEAVADEERRRVVLTWAANHEPDLLGYQVLRSVDGGVAQALANITASEGEIVTFTDDGGQGGELAYQVVAVRRGASPERFVAGPLSATATASLPRPVTTTSVPDSGSAGVDGGTGTGGTAASGGAAPGGLRPTTNAAPAPIRPSSTLDFTGFTPNAPAPKPTPKAEDDPGYEGLLPYQTKAEPGDDPVVRDAALPTESLTETTTENRKALLTFLAGAMVLFMLSMHLRWLLRRVTPVAHA